MFSKDWFNRNAEADDEAHGYEIEEHFRGVQDDIRRVESIDFKLLFKSWQKAKVREDGIDCSFCGIEEAHVQVKAVEYLEEDDYMLGCLDWEEGSES